MDSPLLDLGRARIVKGRGLSLPLSLAERILAARGVRQAVVKVTGFGRGMKGVTNAMDYISRKGELPLEKDTGELIQGREEQKELVKEWSIDFDGPKNSRDSAQIVFSMPPGSSVEALRAAVRNTGVRAFPDNEWVFGIHQDTKHPHAHMVVKMRGKERGNKLQLKKADLRDLRATFAEAAREQGVMLAASPRAARGIGRKGERQAIRALKKKGIRPEVEKQTIEEALQELRKGDWKEKPWEKAMAERNKLERQAYRQEGAALRQKAEKETNEAERERMLKDAGLLEQFAQRMRHPKTKRQALKMRMWQYVEKDRREKARALDRGMER